MKNTFSNKIKSINENFDGDHYLQKNSRSIESIYKMLRYKSIKYKETIEAAQKEFSKSIGVWPKYSKYSLVACSIAGKSKKVYSFGTSHKTLKSYNEKIFSRLKILGNIGAKSNLTDSSNEIGKCAEIKSANYLLNDNDELDVSDIYFTSAIRPRTLEKIPRCSNCIHIFGSE